MSGNRDNPAGASDRMSWKPPRRRRQQAPTGEDAPTDDEHLERKGRFLVYTGPGEPFDARKAIEEAREERAP